MKHTRKKTIWICSGLFVMMMFMTAAVRLMPDIRSEEQIIGQQANPVVSASGPDSRENRSAVMTSGPGPVASASAGKTATMPVGAASDLPEPAGPNPEIVDDAVRNYIFDLYFTHRHAGGKEEFLAAVTAQIMQDFPEETAKEILAIYNAYLDCELRLQEQLLTYEQPENDADMLFIANDIHAFRQSQLGEELADNLFGHVYRQSVYKIKNRKIYEDDSLYGEEKEMRLRLLAAEIFGEKADENLYDKTGESLFQEKRLLYKKDFEEMTEAEKKAKIREFRAEYLSAEEIRSIEAAEEQMASARRRDLSYTEQETAIRNMPDLSEAEKQEKIRLLQDQLYGDRAEAIREDQAFARRHNENMQQAIEAVKSLPDHP